MGQIKDIAGSYPDLIATSKASRNITAQNSTMLDGKIANLSGQQQQQGGMFTDPNTGIQYNGTGPDGKPLRSATQNTPSLPSGTAADFANSYDVVNNVQNKTKYEAMLANEQKASGGQNGAGTAGQPSAAQGIANEQNALLDSQLGTANDTLSKTLASASADEAALIQSIQATYAARRQKMEDLNTRMLEGKRIAGISAGRQRYATGMEGGLLSNEEMDGLQRITELQAEELSLIVKAKQARSETQIKAFNDYADRLTAINSEKIDVLTKLQSATIEADKAIADKKKEEKAAVLDQTRLADSIAPAALQAYTALKTPEEKSAFVQKLAEKYGIHPEMVQSSMLAYSDEYTKATLEQDLKREQVNTEKAQQSNYYSQITDRTNNPGGKAKAENPLTQAETMLESGAKTSDGTVFNGRGSDGYVDPYLYIQIYNGWDTEAEKVAFLKKFPPEDNINPEFPAEELPQAIKVKLGL